MKITLEFEHPHELIDLLKALGSSLKEDTPCTGVEFKDTCSFAGTKHDLCDSPNCENDKNDLGLKGYSYDD